MFVQSSPAQESQPEKPKQFIYVLHLVPRLYADANWTGEDKLHAFTVALERKNL